MNNFTVKSNINTYYKILNFFFLIGKTIFCLKKQKLFVENIRNMFNRY